MKRRKLTREELIEDLVFVASEMGAKKISYSLYRRCGGKYSDTTFIIYFGSWNKAVLEAGLLPYCIWRLTKEDLFMNFERLWDKFGQMPTKSLLQGSADSICTKAPYIRVFGSWTNAKKEFLEWSGRTEPVFEKRVRKGLGVSDKIRYLVFERDDFKCRACGDYPPNCVLQIDHIVPYSKGGSNDIDNLQTLCRVCNLGKGTRIFPID